MYKVIPGNRRYKISKAGEIVRTDGLKCTLPIKEKRVTLNLYGKLK